MVQEFLSIYRGKGNLSLLRCGVTPSSFTLMGVQFSHHTDRRQLTSPFQASFSSSGTLSPALWIITI